MHYLLNQNKLSEAGTYFGLVQIRKVPVEQAIQQAFGMSPAQLEQAVKDYFHAFASAPPAQPNTKAGAGAPGAQVNQFPAPLGPLDVGASVVDVVRAQAQSLVAEMALRLPEHRDQGEKDLADQSSPTPKGTTRSRTAPWPGSAWKERNSMRQARNCQGAGTRRARYLDTLLSGAGEISRRADPTENRFEGVSNMIQDLVFVVDKEPDFAEAHHMLAMARLQGGGVHSATGVDQGRDPAQSAQRAVSAQPGADRSRRKEVGRRYRSARTA